MASTSPLPGSTQQQQQHHLINANSMLSMTSIGFGIDSSPAAALGDATESALRAMHDAMERSSLRLPISSPAHNLLQIRVKLGVPARQDGSGEPMLVNVTRLSAFLPQVIPVLPVQVVVGGLYLPSESQGSPSICTAVACITLQSQATTLTLPPSHPAMMAAHQVHQPHHPSATKPSSPWHSAAAAGRRRIQSSCCCRSSDTIITTNCNDRCSWSCRSWYVTCRITTDVSNGNVATASFESSCICCCI